MMVAWNVRFLLWRYITTIVVVVIMDLWYRYRLMMSQQYDSVDNPNLKAAAPAVNLAVVSVFIYGV